MLSTTTFILHNADVFRNVEVGISQNEVCAIAKRIFLGFNGKIPLV